MRAGPMLPLLVSCADLNPVQSEVFALSNASTKCEDFCAGKLPGPDFKLVSCEGPVTIDANGAARFADGTVVSGNQIVGTGSHAILCKMQQQYGGCGGPGALFESQGEQ